MMKAVEFFAYSNCKSEYANDAIWKWKFDFLTGTVG